MTSEKIQRPKVAQRLRETETEAVPPPPRPSIGKVVPITAVEEAEDTQSSYGLRPKALDANDAGPEGIAVSTSASPDQLWPGSVLNYEEPPLAVRTLKNLTSKDAEAARAQLEHQQKELEGRIHGRARLLDEKWNGMKLPEKVSALENYLQKTGSLPDDTRKTVEAAVSKAKKAVEDLAEAEAKVDALKSKPKQVVIDKKGIERLKHGSSEDRDALALALRAARTARTKGVSQATEAIDAAGMLLDRLAIYEEQTEPHATGDSLRALMSAYFDASFKLAYLKSIILEPTERLLKELKQQAETRRQDARRADDLRQKDNYERIETANKLKKSLLAAQWEKRNDYRRTVIVDLSKKVEVELVRDKRDAEKRREQLVEMGRRRKR